MKFLTAPTVLAVAALALADAKRTLQGGGPGHDECQQHCTTPAQVVGCILAARGHQGSDSHNVDLASVTVDGCIYWGTDIITTSESKIDGNVTEYRRNNGLYQGTVMKNTLRSKADTAGVAFAWVKGSDHIEDVIRNLYKCTFIDKRGDSACIEDFLLTRQMQQEGYPPNYATDGVTQNHIVDLCKLNPLANDNDGRSDYTVGITPDVANMARYIKLEYLQKGDYGKKSFSFGTLAALNPKLLTPPQNYAAALFEQGASCSALFGDALLVPFSAMDEDQMKNITDKGCYLKENAKLTVDAINDAGGNMYNIGTEACLEAYLGAQDEDGNYIWDSPESLRVALDACFDASSLCAITGQGWWPGLKHGGFATTEWLVPNTMTQQELHFSDASLEAVIVSCDGEVGKVGDATKTTCEEKFVRWEPLDGATGKAGKGSKGSRGVSAPAAVASKARDLVDKSLLRTM